MLSINNDLDCRIFCTLIHMEEKRNNNKKTIIDMKKAVREYVNKEENINKRIVKDCGIDGYISLEKLPDGIKSLDEAKEFFENNMYIHCPNSMYDCTGRPFTSWYKVFCRNGKFYAYHRVSFDV